MSEDRLAEPEMEAAEVEITEAEPTPDAPETPEPEATEEEVKPVPTVPLSALNEARHQMRELKERLAEEARQREELKRQFEEIRNAKRQQEQQETFQKDPLGALHQDVRALKEQQERALTEAQQREAYQRQRQDMELQVSQKVQEFSKTAPDYQDALAHMIESRARELGRLGVPQAQIQQVIATESEQLVIAALQRGDNPAEIVYDLAKERGYQPRKAAPKPDIDKIEKGQKASTSLSGTRGAPTDSEPSIADLEDMSDEDFDKLWATKFGKKGK